MCDVMNAIDGGAVDDLQKIFEEGASHGVGSKLKEIWTTDRRQNMQQFQQDQTRNGKSHCLEQTHNYLHYGPYAVYSLQNQVRLHSITSLFLYTVTGKRSNQWNMITIRMGKLGVKFFSVCECSICTIHISL